MMVQSIVAFPSFSITILNDVLEIFDKPRTMVATTGQEKRLFNYEEKDKQAFSVRTYHTDGMINIEIRQETNETIFRFFVSCLSYLDVDCQLGIKHFRDGGSCGFSIEVHVATRLKFDRIGETFIFIRNVDQKNGNFDL